MAGAEGSRRTRRVAHLLGVVEALEVVLAEEAAVGGLAAAAHALAELQPEVVAAALVPVDAPPRRHRRRALLRLPPPPGWFISLPPPPLLRLCPSLSLSTPVAVGVGSPSPPSSWMPTDTAGPLIGCWRAVYLRCWAIHQIHGPVRMTIRPTTFLAPMPTLFAAWALHLQWAFSVSTNQQGPTNRARPAPDDDHRRTAPWSGGSVVSNLLLLLLRYSLYPKLQFILTF
jgi:hypothetical protein